MAEERILLVDDDPDMLSLVKGWLHTAGYQVYSFENGGEALSCAHAEVFDAAVLDLKMEEIDSIVLLEKLLDLQPRFTGHHNDRSRHNPKCR